MARKIPRCNFRKTTRLWIGELSVTYRLWNAARATGDPRREPARSQLMLSHAGPLLPLIRRYNSSNSNHCVRFWLHESTIIPQMQINVFLRSFFAFLCRPHAPARRSPSVMQFSSHTILNAAAKSPLYENISLIRVSKEHICSRQLYLKKFLKSTTL